MYKNFQNGSCRYGEQGLSNGKFELHTMNLARYKPGTDKHTDGKDDYWQQNKA